MGRTASATARAPRPTPTAPSTPASFTDGQRDGQGRIKMPDGFIYEGSWRRRRDQRRGRRDLCQRRRLRGHVRGRPPPGRGHDALRHGRGRDRRVARRRADPAGREAAEPPEDGAETRPMAARIAQTADATTVMPPRRARRPGGVGIAAPQRRCCTSTRTPRGAPEGVAPLMSAGSGPSRSPRSRRPSRWSRHPRGSPCACPRSIRSQVAYMLRMRWLPSNRCRCRSRKCQ